MSLESELRATSDDLLLVLDRLGEMETRKRALPSGSDEFVILSRSIADLSVEVLRNSEREADLAESLAERRRNSPGGAPPVDLVAPAPRDVQVILNEWRAAERELAQTPGTSPESAAASVRVRRLREEYRVAFEAARARTDQ